MTWDVMKWKHFPSYWPFVTEIHHSAVYSPRKGPVTRTADIFCDLLLKKNGWKNSEVAGDLSSDEPQQNNEQKHHAFHRN